MKQCLFIALCLFAITTVGLSQKIKVPAAVTKAFNDKFPTATNVTWGKENATEYEAEFNLGNTAIAANFKTNGSWVVTETTVPADALPAAVKNSITSKYRGAVISRAEKVEKPKAKTYYEVTIINAGKKKELNISEDGHIL